MPGSDRKSITVAAAVCFRNGKVLLTRRMEGTHLAGLWEFPGGKVEPGEDPRHTVVRECLEECAVTVTVEDILDVTFHAYEQKDVLLLFYRCDLAGDQEIQNVGVAEHVWVKPKQIREYPLPPPDENVVAKIERLALR